MHAAIKVGIGFVLGVAAGGSGVYFGLRKKFSEEAQKAIDEYRDIARRRVQAADDFVADKLSEKEAQEYVDICEENGEFIDYTSYFDEKSEDSVKVDTKSIHDELNKLSREVHDKDFDSHMAERESPEEDEEEEDIYEASISDARISAQEEARENGVKPYLIESSEFYNTKHWYSKISITWYMGDEFVCDDQDDIMTETEIEDCLGGYDWKEWFDKDSNDPDVCHVRNDAKGIDYEICRTPDRYSDVYPEEDIDKVKPSEPVIHIS